MGRPKKKSVKLDKESFLSFSQEVYNELVEQRSACIRTINENKKRVQVEDVHDLVNLNKANNDLFKIIDSTIDKKLSLIKLMGNLVFKNPESLQSGETQSLTDTDIAFLREEFEKSSKK